MSNFIPTPYGPKTPELLCRAMDALERESELLKALIELVERAESEGSIHGLPEYDQARAAIDKATEGKG